MEDAGLGIKGAAALKNTSVQQPLSWQGLTAHSAAEPPGSSRPRSFEAPFVQSE